MSAANITGSANIISYIPLTSLKEELNRVVSELLYIKYVEEQIDGMYHIHDVVDTRKIMHDMEITA